MLHYYRCSVDNVRQPQWNEILRLGKCQNMLILWQTSTIIQLKDFFVASISYNLLPVLKINLFRYNSHSKLRDFNFKQSSEFVRKQTQEMSFSSSFLEQADQLSVEA